MLLLYYILLCIQITSEINLLLFHQTYLVSHTNDGDNMKIQLGYVAVPYSIDNITYCKTMTYTSYAKLEKEVAHQKLDILITYNFEKLKEVLRYNHLNHIHFYRLSHNLIPLATHDDVDFEYISTYQKQWFEIGSLIKEYQMRVDTHPDQFCVLNSINPEVVKSTITMLKFHKQMWDAMDYQGKAILHVGGGSANKEEAIQRFKQTFMTLDKDIQDMILLENDDKIFNALDVLEICEELHIPMVLDYHHYRCNHSDEDIIQLLPRIKDTWKHTGLPPKMHYSTGKSKKEIRSHSDFIDCDEFISFLDVVKTMQCDIDIMLECKAKDIALFRLVRELKFKTNLLFNDETSFYL